MALYIMLFGVCAIVGLSFILSSICRIYEKHTDKVARQIIAGKLSDSQTDDIEDAVNYLTPTNSLIEGDTDK